MSVWKLLVHHSREAGLEQTLGVTSGPRGPVLFPGGENAEGQESRPSGRLSLPLIWHGEGVVGPKIYVFETLPRTRIVPRSIVIIAG